ncbi:MAG: FAD-dependent thymidylate synthase [Candidatus Dormibacteraceae bacterium]
MAYEDSDLTATESAQLQSYLTNSHGRTFALRNLPEVVKGALFSRYSRTEKSLRRVLLDEFLPLLEADSEPTANAATAVADQRAEEFYQRVLVGYGDDSVAELAGAHLAIEQVSTLAAKALEDSRIGISPLEKSTRYVRFDRRNAAGNFAYYRGPELTHPTYISTLDALFQTYSDLLPPLIQSIRDRYPLEEGENQAGWKSATRAKALDLIRGLLPAATLTNLGLFGNGRAFEYLLTKLAASELPECVELAPELHQELAQVIPAFVRRALDERYGEPAIKRLRELRQHTITLAPPRSEPIAGDRIRLIEYNPRAEAIVAAAALFPFSDQPLDGLELEEGRVGQVLTTLLTGRGNRRHKLPRALEQADYTFELVASYAAYRDLHRHRMVSQQRQLLGSTLGYELSPELSEYGIQEQVNSALEQAGAAHRRLTADLGPELAQYVVPLTYRMRWYIKANLREIYHLCELRSTPQGHPEYRWLAQEMFRQVQAVHPRLTANHLVDFSSGAELERRAAERRQAERAAK